MAGSKARSSPVSARLASVRPFRAVAKSQPSANHLLALALREGVNLRLTSCFSSCQESALSAYPLRRTFSMTSADKQGATRCWQVTLRERLGTPGRPPGIEELPSLYDPKRERLPASGMSRSRTPSTVGPAPSIVAWFAQFRCEQCGRIPMSMDAQVCLQCGAELTIPVPPATAPCNADANAGARGHAYWAYRRQLAIRTTKYNPQFVHKGCLSNIQAHPHFSTKHKLKPLAPVQYPGISRHSHNEVQSAKWLLAYD